MQAWISTDDLGRQYLVRLGVGTVTAVVPLTVDEVRVEIDCVAPSATPRSIRFSTHGVVASSAEAAEAANEAMAFGHQVTWCVEWHRNDDIPATLPIQSLNLTTDAHAVLAQLQPAFATVEELTNEQAR